MKTARATIENERIYVAVDFLQNRVVKEIPGYTWEPATKRWSFPADATHALSIRMALGGVNGDAAFAALLEAGESMEAARRGSADVGTLPPIPQTKTNPWAHQVAAFWFVVGLFGGLPR